MKDNIYKKTIELKNEKHFWFAARKEILISVINKLLKGKNNLNILDIGSLDGYISNGLTKFGVVTIADKYPDKINSIGVMYCDIENNINIPGNLDLILLFDVLEHIENDTNALRNMHNALKIGGNLILTVPAYQFMFSKHDKDHGHIRRYTLKQIKKKLLHVGFEINRISYFNSILFPLIFIYRFLFPEKNSLGLPPKFINNILYRLFLSEKLLLNLLNIPFGLSILSIAKKIK